MECGSRVVGFETIRRALSHANYYQIRAKPGSEQDRFACYITKRGLIYACSGVVQDALVHRRTF